MSHNAAPNTAAPSVDLESVLARERAGAGLSRYQARAVGLCALAAMLSAMSTSEYVFTTGRTRTRCLIPECENATESSEFAPTWIGNSVPQAASGFDSCRRFTNVTDTLGLACDEWRRSLLGSARTLGALLSLPVAGAISDRWGRRTALVIVSFNTACLGILRVLATSYLGFIMSVFAEATLGAGAILACCYVLGVEMMPVKYRIVTGVTINSISSAGQVILGLLAWALPNWRHLTLVIYVPQLLTLAYIWVVPESLRWYLSKGRYVEAEVALKQMAKVNGNELSEKTLLELKQGASYMKAKAGENKSDNEPWLIAEVFRYKPILLRVLTAPIWWITTILIYYGLSVNAVHISGNMYINFMVVSIVDIPGFWTSTLLLDRIGRKSVIIAGFWVCGACQIVYIFMPKGLYAASLTVYLVGKFSISMVGTSIYVYTSELYPTRYRHRLFGFTSMLGRVGSIMAPLTPALGAMVWEQLPFVLFAGMSLVAGLLVFLTPETKGCRLPDTMQEAADLGKPARIRGTGRDNHGSEL